MSNLVYTRMQSVDWDFPGGPVVKTPRFHYRGHRFDPWLENWDPTCHTMQPNRKQKSIDLHLQNTFLEVKFWIKSLGTHSFGRSCWSSPKGVIPFILNQHYRKCLFPHLLQHGLLKNTPLSLLSLNMVVSVISLFWVESAKIPLHVNVDPLQPSFTVSTTPHSSQTLPLP